LETRRLLFLEWLQTIKRFYLKGGILTMAESSIPYTVITNYRREKLCKITSGAVNSIPAITKIAFGDQGVDASGKPVSPAGSQTALKHEVGRYPIKGVTYPISTTARYTVTIPAADLAGVAISEAALVDASGQLCAIRNMLSKGKDGDVEFTFTFDDEF